LPVGERCSSVDALFAKIEVALTTVKVLSMQAALYEEVFALITFVKGTQRILLEIQSSIMLLTKHLAIKGEYTFATETL
jgi:hypothetical protein